MSVDYSLVIKRKKDNKKIAEFYCNQIKSILDSDFKNIIHCDDTAYDRIHPKFTTSELSNLTDLIYQKIENTYKEIQNNQLLICSAKSKEVADEYREENRFLLETINEDLRYQHEACCNIMGKIQCVVEDLIKKNKSAYQYNANGLDDKDTIWCDDIYCELVGYY